MTDDKINHPPHYNLAEIKCTCGKPIECIDVIGNKGFVIGSAIKYLWRYEHKNGVEDLRKSLWYISHEIERLESEQNKPKTYKTYHLSDKKD
jgi:hypothetical protein